MLLAV
jgi:hypothetical protein